MYVVRGPAPKVVFDTFIIDLYWMKTIVQSQCPIVVVCFVLFIVLCLCALLCCRKTIESANSIHIKSLKEKCTLISNMHYNLFKRFFFSGFTLSISVHLYECVWIPLYKKRKKTSEITAKFKRRNKNKWKKCFPSFFLNALLLLLLLVLLYILLLLSLFVLFTFLFT